MIINQAGSGYSLKVSGGNLSAATTSYFTLFQGSPGTLTWTGKGSNDAWSNPLNWNLDRAPISGDNLVFPSGPTNLDSANNMTGLKINSIEISGSDYNINGWTTRQRP